MNAHSILSKLSVLVLVLMLLVVLESHLTFCLHPPPCSMPHSFPRQMNHERKIGDLPARSCITSSSLLSRTTFVRSISTYVDDIAAISSFHAENMTRLRLHWRAGNTNNKIMQLILVPAGLLLIHPSLILREIPVMPSAHFSTLGSWKPLFPTSMIYAFFSGRPPLNSRSSA